MKSATNIFLSFPQKVSPEQDTWNIMASVKSDKLRGVYSKDSGPALILCVLLGPRIQTDALS